MSTFLTPPDFFRIFDNASANLEPPPLPSSGTPEEPVTYSMLGGTYTVPPKHVADLTGAVSLVYDPRCLGSIGLPSFEPSAIPSSDPVPTYKQELHRLSKELKCAIREAMLVLAADNPQEDTELQDAVSKVHNIFANISHLLGHLRRNEAFAQIIDLAKS